MIPFRSNSQTGHMVTWEDMKTAYETLKTPRRMGTVIELDGYLTDCPSVFRYQGRWYMYFIAIPEKLEHSGYETHLAASDDLLHWGYVGKLLTRDLSRSWDSRQIAGYPALVDTAFDGQHEIRPFEGRYYLSYLAGASDGYEPDPLSMAVANSPDPLDANGFVRSERPILTPSDPDVRFFERRTLYRSYIFEDTDRLTGHRFVNCYNAKAEDNRERIFLAVSDDMARWERLGCRPVIDDVSGDPSGHISGDPQVVRLGSGMYAMIYFRFRGSLGAYDTFAASWDLEHWTGWDGEPLVAPDPQLAGECVHAHKPCVIKYNGAVYHFYCAVGEKSRNIALAVSE